MAGVSWDQTARDRQGARLLLPTGIFVASIVVVFAVSWVLVPRHGTIYEYHGGATYLDGCALFENEERECNPYLEDCSGDRRQMREGDGIHLSNAGGDRQARAVMRVLLKSYRLES